MKNFAKKYHEIIFVFLLFFSITVIFLFPLLNGLILLPLDLLVTSYAPWHMLGNFLLKNPYMQDSIVQLFPWRHFVFESLANGFIPLWNPYQQMGMPFMANLKPMIFYPLNIFFIFGEVKAWNLLLFSQLFLSLLFAYALAKEMGLRKISSILLAFAFSFNTYMIGLLEFGSDAQTIIWWPLILLCIKKYIDKRNVKYLPVVSLALAFSIFAGQLQYLGYFAILLVLFIGYYGRSVRLPVLSYVYIFLSLLLGVGVSAVQLIPALELFKYSHRGLLDVSQNHQVFSRGLMSLVDIFRLLSPDFFGNPVSHDLRIAYIETSGYFGIVPLFFSIIAIVFERKNKFVRFFTGIFFVSILFSLQGFGEILYFLKIPLLTSGSGERIFVLVLFSGAILSGFGFSSFLKQENIKKIIATVGLFVLATFASVLIYRATHISEVTFLHDVAFSGGILAVFVCLVAAWQIAIRLVKNKKSFITIVFSLLVLSLIFFDLFRLGYRFLTFSNKKFLYPQTPVITFIQKNSHDTLARTYGLVEPEISTYFHIYTAETYNPLFPLRSALLLQAIQGKSNSQLSSDNKYFLTADKDNLKRALDFLGISFVVVGKDENPSLKYFHTSKFVSSLQNVYQDDSYIVYKNMDASPRFGLFYKTQVIPSDSNLLKRLSVWTDADGSTIFLQEKLARTLQNGTGSATLVSNNPNQQIFKAVSTREALFYVSDTFFPGWHATVNGKSVKMYRANYNFRAIVVPAGESIVTFSYLPSSYILGIVVSIFSIVLLAVFGVTSFLQKRF